MRCSKAGGCPYDQDKWDRCTENQRKALKIMIYSMPAAVACSGAAKVVENRKNDLAKPGISTNI
jgi:hypothetical protein